MEIDNFIAKTFKVSLVTDLKLSKENLIHIAITTSDDMNTFFFTSTMDQIGKLAKLLKEYIPQAFVTLNTTQTMSYDIRWSSSDSIIHIKCISHKPYRVIELSCSLAKELASAINLAMSKNEII